MANFGVELTEAPASPNAITPKEGIVQESPLVGLGELLSNFTGSLAESKGNDALVRLETDQLDVLEAISQGTLTSTAGQTRLRANYKAFLQAHPALQTEGGKVQSRVMGSAGMGSVATTGGIQEQREAALITDMIGTGRFNAQQIQNMSRDNLQVALTDYQQYLNAQEHYKRQMELITAESAQLNLSSARRKELDAQRSRLSKDTLVANLPTQFNGLQAQLRQLQNDTSLTPPERLANFEMYWNQIVLDNSVLFADIDGTQKTALEQSLVFMHDEAIAQLNGERTLSSVKDTNDALIEQMKAVALQDPDMAALVLQMDLNPQAFTDINVWGDTKISKVIKESVGLTLGTGEVDPNSLGVNPFLEPGSSSNKALGNFLDHLSRPPRYEEERRVIATQVDNLIRGVTTHEGFIKDDPLRGNAFVQMAADSSFLKVLQEYGSEINLTEAQSIWSTHYSSEVWNMVDKEFRSGQVVDLEAYRAERAKLAEAQRRIGQPADTAQSPDFINVTVDASEVIGYSWVDNSIVFEAFDRENKQAVSRAKDLNETLRPVINNTVRAEAHLSGHQNYSEIWGAVGESLMTGELPEDTDPGDDLNMEDFKAKMDTSEFSEISDTAFQTATFLGDTGLFEPHHLAGILGNAAVESGNNFNASAIGDNGNAMGLFQWNGPRMRDLKEFAAEQGADPTDPFTQLNFLMLELRTTERTAYRKLLEAKTAEEAALAFSKYYERPGTPHNDRRVASANKFFKMLTGG